MSVDKLRRRFNIPAEWPRSLIESESAYLHRLIATGVRYGVGARCATNKHDTCTDTPGGCRCYCHAELDSPDLPAEVLDFINTRPEYIDALKNTRGTDDLTDYNRWQGHAEARRQLATSLGYTVPHNTGDTTRKEES